MVVRKIKKFYSKNKAYFKVYLLMYLVMIVMILAYIIWFSATH